MWMIEHFIDNGAGVMKTGENILQGSNIKTIMSQLKSMVGDSSLYAQKDTSVKSTVYFIYSRNNDELYIRATKYN